ncbi:MAG TPA: HD domain-containing phosphohydrolase [Gemmatimonadaceae bacterium]|jgi:HD-GYP domain-containing protein (c-di-GMP phosphodiesterase class II)
MRSSRASVVLGLLTGGAFVYRERRSRGAIERVAAAALETLLNAIEANDDETGKHVRRVASGALIIAEAAGLDERQQRAVERVALFHDIGKIHEALFDIVHEQTRLTRAERRAIATHPLRGAEVLDPLAAFYPELPEGVLSHHERWDGKGYPRGLKGRRIPIEARITTIADTFDAITHNRRYREKSGVSRAVHVLAEGRGTQFDPELVDLALLPPILEQMSRVHIVAQSRRHTRQARARESVPDVSFRWRSESLGSRRVRATRDID